MHIEKRYFEIKSISNEENKNQESPQSVFTGKAVLFDQETTLCEGIYEKVDKKAFERALKDDDIRCLFNHDPNYVIGRKKSGTLELEERDDGLYFSVVPPENQWCKDLEKSIKRGDINQCSFAFSVKKDEFKTDEEGGIHRTILDGKLYDVSIVTYPAYEETLVNVRSRVEEFKKNNLPKKITNVSEKLEKFLEERRKNNEKQSKYSRT